MKINWGTGLAIWLVIFIVFILQFVIRISVQDKYDNELVTENYYEKELVFQEQIDGITNANKNHIKLKSQRTDKGFELIFPENLDASKIEGSLVLYRPSNKKLDREEELKLDSNKLIIPKEQLVSGRWDIIIAWSYEGEAYYHKEKINY